MSMGLEEEILSNIDLNESKRIMKNAVFRETFDDEANILELYRNFFPDDADVSVEDLWQITIDDPQINTVVNTMAYVAKETIFLFVEAQRAELSPVLDYSSRKLIGEINDYCRENMSVRDLEDLDMYVIYSAEKESTGGDQFWKLIMTEDVIASKVLRASDELKGGILEEYAEFCKVVDENMVSSSDVKPVLKECRYREGQLWESVADKESAIVELYREMAVNEYNILRIINEIDHSMFEMK